MSIDPAVSMALAVHSHKGVYALLLGSGVSRSAGIPTGWEVIIDLIGQLAAAGGDNPPSDAEAWYRDKFKKDPSYSDLLEMLAPKPAERTSLLKRYFEPTVEEREQGLKLPTEAHKAIARLVAAGFIRIIVTTNFDRLTERAIEAEGISPTIVSTADQIEGMMPLPHVKCLVFKVHGDYLDTRLLNTPAELAQYPDELNHLLDRVFSEYGLVLCGWSADWDRALVAAITRNTRFRFSTYWLSRGELSPAAKDLATRRQAVVVPIPDADTAFTDLSARVDAIDQQRLGDPSSPRLAVAMAKRFLSSSERRIDFHDLVMREVSVVRNKTSGDMMPLHSPKPDNVTYPRRANQMVTACSTLIPIVATGALWDDGTHDDLWKRCVQALSRSERVSSIEAWSTLQYLPATMVAYAVGVGALISGRLHLFKVVFEEAAARGSAPEPAPAINVIGVGRCLTKDAAQRLHDPITSKKTPGADWMVEQLQAMLDDVVPADVEFEELYDELEFIISLISTDLTNWPMPGRFMWRTGRFESHPDKVARVRKELDDLGSSKNEHRLLTAGLCGGELARLHSALNEVERVARLIAF